MARWFYNRPSENCDESEIKVANKLRRLSKRWTIRWGFYYVDNKGIRREGDFLIFDHMRGLLVLPDGKSLDLAELGILQLLREKRRGNKGGWTFLSTSCAVSYLKLTACPQSTTGMSCLLGAQGKGRAAETRRVDIPVHLLRARLP